MQRLSRFSIIFFAIMLITASIQGQAQNVDCRSCHAPDGISGARDFSQYYTHPPDGHPIGRGFHFNHPVGMKFPAGLNANQKFKPPNVRSADITFFDRNGNGQPDSDEVQLFADIDDVTGEVIGENGDVTVECASCHKAHGNAPVPVNTPGNFYLRIDNKGSALCLTCHSK